MTDCPNCGSEVTVDDHVELDDVPVEAMWLVCTGCDFETVLTRLSYPQFDFEAILDSSDQMCDRCGDDATWRVERNSVDRRDYCDDCIPRHCRLAYRSAARVLARRRES